MCKCKQKVQKNQRRSVYCENCDAPLTGQDGQIYHLHLHPMMVHINQINLWIQQGYQILFNDVS